MQYTLKNNAYNILGLDTTANERDILRRSKEILNRLKIDDVPEYDLDIDFFENLRTEESVKEATQKLQTPKKQIKECFFWFQFADTVDKEVLELIRHKDFSNSIYFRSVNFGSNDSRKGKKNVFSFVGTATL